MNVLLTPEWLASQLRCEHCASHCIHCGRPAHRETYVLVHDARPGFPPYTACSGPSAPPVHQSNTGLGGKVAELGVDGLRFEGMFGPRTDRFARFECPTCGTSFPDRAPSIQRQAAALGLTS